MSREKQHLSAKAESREKSDEERKSEIRKSLDFAREKQILFERIEKDKKLAYLKSLVERGLISLSTVENIVDGKDLETRELKEIFDKIDSLSEMQNIDEILPERLRITKEEYLLAIENREKRDLVIQKLDDSLDYLNASSS